LRPDANYIRQAPDIFKHNLCAIDLFLLKGLLFSSAFRLPSVARRSRSHQGRQSLYSIGTLIEKPLGRTLEPRDVVGLGTIEILVHRGRIVGIEAGRDFEAEVIRAQDLVRLIGDAVGVAVHENREDRMQPVPYSAARMELISSALVPKGSMMCYLTKRFVLGAHPGNVGQFIGQPGSTDRTMQSLSARF